MIPRTHLLIVLATVALTAAVSVYAYPRLPNPCPIHWNLRGEVDDYGSPLTMAMIAPCVSLGVAVLMAGLPLLGPFRSNFEKFRTTYGRLAVTIMIFFLGLQVVLLRAAATGTVHIGPTLCVLLGLMFAVMGNWMGKIRQNFYIGIRTPWTLANETVWEKTHRLGGKLFVAAGLISTTTGLLAGNTVCFVVLMSSIVGAVGTSVLYSVVEYRKLGQIDDLAHDLVH